MSLVIEWKDGDDWKKIDTGVLLSNTLKHTLDLFSKPKRPVRAKSNGCIIVSDLAIFSDYKGKAKIVTFESIRHSRAEVLEKELRSVGLVGEFN